jgi:H+/Cl- antiporter ClcA
MGDVVSTSTPAVSEQHESLPLKALGLSALIGVVAAVGATLLLAFFDNAEQWVWHDLPSGMGMTELPAWFVFAAMLVGAGVVALAWRLPGATGKSPLTGLHFDTLPINAASFLLAAFGSLVFGFVLGPEAPLVILGTTIGALIMRGRPPKMVQLAMLLGGAAAIGAIFGNPFVTAFMLLEFAAMGAMPAAVLMPAFVALGSGYIVQVGIGSWMGLGTHVLAVPGMPAYPELQWGDLVGGVVIAIVAALCAALARELGERVQALAVRRRGIVLVAVALLTSALAVGVAAATGVGVELVLFSGQPAMPELIAETSAMTVLLIVVAKVLAYGLALGGGYRGGPIFPATFIGVGVGVLASLVFTDLSVSAMAAAGIAATATVMLRLPFTSAMLGMLLIGAAGMAVAPLAILGAVIGFGVRQGLDRLDAKRPPAVPVTA